VAAYYRKVLDRIAAIPSVQAAGSVDWLPLAGGDREASSTIAIQGKTDLGARTSVVRLTASPDYFRAMRISLLRGSYFNEQDTSTKMPVALISESLARGSWKDEDPIGKCFRFGTESNNRSWITVVGVVGDIMNDRRGKPLPHVYLASAQNPLHSMALVVRTSASPVSMAEEIKQAVWEIDRDQPIDDVKPMRQVLSEELAGSRLLVEILATLSALALALASLGVYSVMSYNVAQRTHELGIRMALGARPSGVLLLIMGQGLLLVADGLVIGLVGAFSLGRIVAHELLGISPADPLTMLSISLLLAVVALLASYIPARRATKVDPMVALRCE
jgi:putative ABC transport system permease protein